jgi:DNA polymerase III alpha subunit (gram-positive type)
LVENDHPAATFSRLIKMDAAIPRHITDLTGIDRSLMEQEGLPLPTALAEFLEFIGSRPWWDTTFLSI